MAGGGGFSRDPNNGKEYPGSLTLYVTITCIVAAMGGLIFGYDIGISGTFLCVSMCLYVYVYVDANSKSIVDGLKIYIHFNFLSTYIYIVWKVNNDFQA